MSDYLPDFKDNDGRIWEVLSMNWCIDFGGRQCQIEAQYQTHSGQFITKYFVIYGLDGEFVQFDSLEILSCSPVKGVFFDLVMNMFAAFDSSGSEKNP